MVFSLKQATYGDFSVFQEIIILNLILFLFLGCKNEDKDASSEIGRVHTFCYDCAPCGCVNGLEFSDGECWVESEVEPVGLCHPNRDPELPNFEIECTEVCE